MAAFTVQWQNEVVVTETVWPAKPKLFMILPLKRKKKKRDKNFANHRLVESVCSVPTLKCLSLSVLVMAANHLI